MNNDPWELLREVREEWTRIHSFYADGVALDAKLLSRVDAALAAHEMAEAKWFYDSFGQMAYWKDVALMVGKWEGREDWRWSVVHSEKGLLAHGYVAGEPEAKEAALKAAKDL